MHSPRTEKSLVQHDLIVMSAVGLAHGISHFGHLLLSPLFAFFVKDFGLTYTALGSLMTAFFVVSGIGQALAGFVVDRFGVLPSLFASLGLLISAAIVATCAQGYGSLLMVAVLAGLGNASFHPVDFSILNHRVSSQRLGYALSLHGLMGNVGWGIAGLFLVGIAQATHWRWAYGAAVGLISAITLGLWLLRRHLFVPPTHHHVDTLQPRVSTRFLLKQPVVWLCFIFFCLSTMSLSVIQSFASPILQITQGLTLSSATQVISSYMGLAVIGGLLGGWLLTRHPHMSERVVAICLMGGGLLLLVCATGYLSTPLMVGAVVLGGLSLGVAGPSRDMMIKHAAPPGAVGRVYGLVYSGLDTGFALSPLLFGRLMDAHQYSAVWAGAGLLLLLAVCLALGVERQIVGRAR
jgi:FSR family fosmidomycin resistance protein-like MFS transporter